MSGSGDEINTNDEEAVEQAVSSSSSPSLSASQLFREPADFYEAEKPATFTWHTLLSGQTLNLRLVGHNPLWGHVVWNASRVATDYLEEHADELVRDKTVLELGAGAGLPSLACALVGARKVIVTDYPDEELVQNLRYNIEHAPAAAGSPATGNIVAEGYLWGVSASKLTAHLDAGNGPGGADSSGGGFDLLILADLLFNHSEHRKLVSSMQRTVKRVPEGRALVFFTPHRPWLFDRDLAFFDLAREAGFVVEKVLERRLEHAMRIEGGPAVRKSVNDNDDESGVGGDEKDVKKVVYGFQLQLGRESS